jgi:cytochrome b
MPFAPHEMVFTGGLMLATVLSALVFSAAAGGVARLRQEARFGARQDALWRHILVRTSHIVSNASGLHRTEVERLAMAELGPLIAMHVALAEFMPDGDREAVKSFLEGATRRHILAELDRRQDAADVSALAGAA